MKLKPGLAVAAAFLALSTLAPTLAKAQAEGQPDTGQRWSLQKYGTSCEARLPIEGFAETSIVYLWAYRGNRQPTVTLTGKLGWTPPIPEDDTRPPPSAQAELVWADSGEAAATGTVVDRSQQMGSYSYGDQFLFTDAAKSALAGRTADEAALLVKVGGQDLARLPMGGVSLADSGIEACHAELGEDLMSARPEGEQPGGGARGPVPRNNPGSWITSNDYPSRALRQMDQGTTRFDVTIDRYGFVEDCRIIVSSGSERLDYTACRMVERRARFYPARDAEDRAVPASWQQNVIWYIPG